LKAKLLEHWLELNDPMTSNIQTPNRNIYIITTASRCISTSTSLPSLKFRRFPGAQEGSDRRVCNSW
jgi:hypothetical protein